MEHSMDVFDGQTIESPNSSPRYSSLSTSSGNTRTAPPLETRDESIPRPSSLSIDHFIRNPSTSADNSSNEEDLLPQNISGNDAETLPQHLPNVNSGPLENEIDSHLGNVINKQRDNATSNENSDATIPGVGPETVYGTSTTSSRFSNEMIAQTHRMSSSTTKEDKPKNPHIASSGYRKKKSLAATPPPPRSPSTPVSIKNHIIFDGESVEQMISPSRFSTERKKKIDMKRPSLETAPSRFSTDRVTLKRMNTPPTTPKLGTIVTTERLDADYTVVFEHGEVGLQLEPVNGLHNNVCRVARFVDGGPKSPGQARKTGKIHPGDFVIQVVTDGNDVANTHGEIIQMLRNVNTQRVVTLRPAFPSTRLGSVKEGQSSSQHPQSSSPLSPPAMPVLRSKLKTLDEEEAATERSITPSHPAAQHRLPPPEPATVDQQNLPTSSPSTARAILERSSGSQSSTSIDDSNEAQRIDSLQVQLFRETGNDADHPQTEFYFDRKGTETDHDEDVGEESTDTKEITIQNLLEQLREMESSNKKLKIEVEETKRRLDFEKLNRKADIDEKEEELSTLRLKSKEMEQTDTETKRSLDETLATLEDKQEILEQMEHLFETKESEMQERISVIESQKRVVEEELVSVQIELEMSRSMVEGMESHIRDLEISKTELSKSLKSARQTNDNESVSIDETVHNGEEDIESLEKMFQEQKGTLIARDAEVSELQSENKRLKEDIEALQAMLGDEQKRVIAKEADLEELQSTNRALSSGNNHLEGIIGRAEAEMVALCQSKESLEVELSNARSRYEEKEESMKAQILQSTESLECDKAALSRKVGEMADKLNAVHAENERLNKELDKMVSEIGSDRSRAFEAQDRQEQNEAPETLAELHKKEESWRTLLQESKEKTIELGSQLEMLNYQLASSRRTIASLQEEKDTIKQLSHDLRQELDESVRSKSALSDKLSRVENQHKQEVAHLETEVASLQASKSALEQEFPVKEDSKLKELANVRQDLELLESLLLEKEMELDIMREKVTSLETENANSRARGLPLEFNPQLHEEMQDQIMSLEASKKDLQQQLKALFNEKTNHQEESEKKIAMLSSELEMKSSDLDATLTAMKASDTAATEAREILEEENSNYDLRLQEANNRIDDLVKELEILEGSKSSLEDHVEDLSASKSNELAAYDKKVQSLESQLNQNEDDLKSTIDILNMTKREICQRETEIQDIQDKANALEETNKGLSNQLQELAPYRERSEKHLSDVVSKLESLRAEISSTVEAHEVEKQNLVSELDSLKTEMTKSESSRVEATEEMGSLQSQIERLTSHNQGLVTQLDALKSSAGAVSELNDTISILQAELGAKTKELDQARLELDELRIEKPELQEKLFDASGEVSELKTVLSELRGILQQKEVETESWKLQFDELNGEKPKLETKLSYATDKASELEATISRLKDELQQNDEHIETAKQKLGEVENDKNELETRLSGTNDTIAELESAMSELRDELHEKENNLSSTQNLIEGLQTELKECYEKIEKLEDENSTVVNENADVETKLVDVSATVGILETANAALKGELQDREEDFTAVQNQVEELRLQLDESRDEVSASRAEVDTLKREKDALLENYDVASMKLADSKVELEDVKASKQLTLDENAKLEDELSAVTTAVDSLSAANDELKEELRQTEEENWTAMETHNLELEELRSERKDLLGKIAQSEAQYSSASTEIATLTDQVKALTMDRNGLNKQITEYETQCSQSADEILALDGQVEELTIERDALLGKISSDQVQYSQSAREILALENQVKSLSSLCSEFENQLGALQASNTTNVEELKKTILLLKDEVNTKSIKIKQQSEELQQKNGRFVSLQESLEDVKVEKSRIESELSVVKTSCDTLSVRNAELQSLMDNNQNELQTTGSVLKATVRLCQSLESQLEELRSQRQDSETRLQTDLVAKDELIKKYKHDSDSVVQNLMRDLQNRGVFLHESRDMIKNLESCKAGLSKQVDSLTASIKQVENEKESLLEDVNRLKGDLVDAKNDAHEAHERLLQQLESGATEQQKLDETVNLLREATEKAKTLEIQANTRREEFNEAKATIDATREEMTALKQEYTSLQTKLDESTQQKVGLMEEISKAQSQVLELTKTAEEVQQENAMLQEEVNEVRKELLDSKKSSDEARNQLSEKLGSTLRQAKDKLKQKIEDLEEKAKLLREADNNIVSLQSQLDAANRQISDSADTIDRLEKQGETMERQYQNLEIRLHDSDMTKNAVVQEKSRTEAQYSEARNAIFALETKVASLEASNKIFEREIMSPREIPHQTSADTGKPTSALVKLLAFVTLVSLASLFAGDGGSPVTFIWNENDVEAIRNRNARRLVREDMDDGL